METFDFFCFFFYYAHHHLSLCRLAEPEFQEFSTNKEQIPSVLSIRKAANSVIKIKTAAQLGLICHG